MASDRTGDGGPAVMTAATRYGLNDRLVDALHTEALLLADEARAYFEQQGRSERDGLAPGDRVLFSCESLKVTTRLMHVVAWLLTRRSLGLHRASDRPVRPLGDAVPIDEAAIAALPVTARQLIVASRDLHDRVRRLETRIDRHGAEGASPARLLMGLLERAL